MLRIKPSNLYGIKTQTPGPLFPLNSFVDGPRDFRGPLDRFLVSIGGVGEEREVLLVPLHDRVGTMFEVIATIFFAVGRHGADCQLSRTSLVVEQERVSASRNVGVLESVRAGTSGFWSQCGGSL